MADKTVNVTVINKTTTPLEIYDTQMGRKDKLLAKVPKQEGSKDGTATFDVPAGTTLVATGGPDSPRIYVWPGPSFTWVIVPEMINHP